MKASLPWVLLSALLVFRGILSMIETQISGFLVIAFSLFHPADLPKESKSEMNIHRIKICAIECKNFAGRLRLSRNAVWLNWFAYFKETLSLSFSLSLSSFPLFVLVQGFLGLKVESNYKWQSWLSFTQNRSLNCIIYSNYFAFPRIKWQKS